MMRVPILLVRQSFVDAIVEIAIVREDDMTADVVELESQSNAAPSRSVERSEEVWVELPDTYEAFGSDVGRCKTTWRLVGVNDEP